MFNGSRRRRFVSALLTWYRRQHRELPWRGERNPYRVLLSEVMLQQTQASRVAERYPIFLRTFPDLRSLASARRASVIRAWAGMGYNNRAVRLHTLAGTVVREHGGTIPRAEGPLAALPGVGPYTVAAVRCFAFGASVPVVDVNVHRVLSRVVVPRRHPDDRLSAPAARAVAAEILPRGRAREWNQALMDLGALVCTARAPRCGLCPVGHLCATRPVLRTSPPRRRRSEPSRRGVPDRITRGRVVQVLRTLSGRREMDVEELAARVMQGYSARERSWLMGLLRGLERDGLVRPGTSGPNRVRLA